MDTELAAFMETLAADERDVLQAADAQLDNAFGKDAESTFRKGEALIAARDGVPDRTFSTWCALRWPKHRTYAYPHINVAERLRSYRERLIDAGVLPSTLLVLGAHPDQAEALLELYQGKHRPTHQQGKALILGRADQSAEDVVPPADPGGLAGLRRLHAAKKEHLTHVTERIERIIIAVEDALSAPRLLKGKLIDATMMEARWARAELYNLCAFIEPAPWDATKPEPVAFPKQSGWSNVVETLYDLGGQESWPPQSDLMHWLTSKVLPHLRWAARGEGEINPVAAAEAVRTPVHVAVAIATRTVASDVPEELLGDDSDDLINVADTDATQDAYLEITPDAAIVRTTADFLVYLRKYCRRFGTPIAQTERILKEAATVIGDSWKNGLVAEGWPGDRLDAHSLSAAAYLACLDDPSSPAGPPRSPNVPAPAPTGRL